MRRPFALHVLMILRRVFCRHNDPSSDTKAGESEVKSLLLHGELSADAGEPCSLCPSLRASSWALLRLRVVQ
jgi:hypothetical protein